MGTKFMIEEWSKTNKELDIGEKEWIFEGLISLLKSKDKDVVGLRQQILRALFIINSRKIIEEQELKNYIEEIEQKV